MDLENLQELFVEGEDEADKLPYRLRRALTHLARGLDKVDFRSLIEAESASGKTIARALLAALARGDRVEAKLLAALFESDDATLLAISRVICGVLGWDQRDILKAMD